MVTLTKDRELMTVQEIAALVASAKDFYDIKDQLIDKMLRATGHNKACLDLFSRDEPAFVYLVCHEKLSYIPYTLRDYPKDENGIRIPLVEYPAYVREALWKLKPVYVQNVHIDPQGLEERSLAELEGYQGRAVFPIVMEEKAVGFITIFVESDNGLIPEHFTFIQAVASLIGLSLNLTRDIQNVQVIVKKLRDTITSIGEATDELYKNKGIDPFLELVNRQIMGLTHSTASLILLEDKEDNLNTFQQGGDVPAMDLIIDFIRQEEASSNQVYRYSLESLPAQLQEPLRQRDIHSMMYVVMRKGTNQIGYAVSLSCGFYTEDDLKVLGIYSTQVALSLIMFIHSRKVFESRLMERDLDLISKQQALIMTDRHLDMKNGITIDYYYKPSQQIGGDFCKLFKVNDHTALIFIADVMGHGILSNYFVAMMKGVLRVLLAEHSSPAEILTRINRILFDDLDALNLFITARIMVLDFKEHIAYSSNAGHIAPIEAFQDSGQVKFRLMEEDEGLPIGVFADSQYPEVQYDIKNTELIAFCTDGIIEAGNIDEQQYGTEGLMRFLKRSMEKSSRQICDTIQKDIEQFNQSEVINDDVMLIVVKKDPAVS